MNKKTTSILSGRYTDCSIKDWLKKNNIVIFCNAQHKVIIQSDADYKSSSTRRWQKTLKAKSCTLVLYLYNI